MRIMTILGTRPEIIRLCRVIAELDQTAEHVLVHTGQNFVDNLSGLFFRELGVREPDTVIESRSDSFGAQIAKILQGVEREVIRAKPDRVLILGDTNSALSTLVIERLGIPVYHMEAGNRCFDRKVPEEINRKLIDSIASYALPYTPGSRENLLRDGISAQRIFVSGNPIGEVLEHYRSKIDQSDVLPRLALREKDFFLVTAHRTENIDDPNRLRQIISGLEEVRRIYKTPIVFSVHPRTRDKLERLPEFSKREGIMYLDALGFFDFVRLEKSARLVLTDSGTVQEECCIFRVPAVTIRDTTERPETIQCGSNFISGVERDGIVAGVGIMLRSTCDWELPQGYDEPGVSRRVAQFLLSHRAPVSIGW